MRESISGVTTIVLATTDGMLSLGVDGVPRAAHHGGRSVTALARSRTEVLVVLDASDVWRSARPEAGPEWVHLSDLPDHRATCITAVGDEVFVGAAEARLFRLADGSLDPVAAFDRAPGRGAWYTPWGGPPDTRSIANWDDDIYVNVHVGGILRTEDGGESWTPTIEIDADVHHVTTADGLVLAACAGGLAVSADRGATWTFRTEGLESRYSRAVAVCGDLVLVSASDGPRGGRAAVYRAPIGGGAFERCRAGLPDRFDDNIDTYCLDGLPDGAVAAFGDGAGNVYVSTDQGSSWERIAGSLPAIHRVLVMP